MTLQDIPVIAAKRSDDGRHSDHDQLRAARLMRERLRLVLDTTHDADKLPSLFADLAAFDEWIAQLESDEHT